MNTTKQKIIEYLEQTPYGHSTIRPMLKKLNISVIDFMKMDYKPEMEMYKAKRSWCVELRPKKCWN